MELKPINVAYTGGIDGLLIVPYGIETLELGQYGLICTLSFNRTLWN